MRQRDASARRRRPVSDKSASSGDGPGDAKSFTDRATTTRRDAAAAVDQFPLRSSGNAAHRRRIKSPTARQSRAGSRTDPDGMPSRMPSSTERNGHAGRTLPRAELCPKLRTRRTRPLPSLRPDRLGGGRRGASARSVACGGSSDDDSRAAEQAALVAQGQQIFRFDTFGDEAQWTDTLRMHEVISAAVDPTTALSVGLKVDAEALPAAVVQGIQNGSVDLHSPATTVALLKLDAVVGLKGTVESVGGQRRAHARRRHLRALPLDGRQLVRARHRQAARRLAQPRPEPRRDPRAVAGVRRRHEGAAQRVGPGQVRSAPQHRRPEQAGRHPAGLRPRRHQQRHLHRRRQRARVLEPLRRRHADGRPRHLHRAAPRPEHHARQRRSRLEQAARAAGVSALDRRAAAAGGQLRPRRRGARPAGVRRRRRLRQLPQRRALHRCQQHAASAGRLDGRARVAELRGAIGDQALSHDAAAEASGSTRRTSTTARRRRWSRSSRPTTRAARSGSPRSSRPTSCST